MFESLKPSNIKKTIQEGRANFKKAMDSGPVIKIKLGEKALDKKEGPVEPADFSLYSKGKLEDPLPDTPRAPSSLRDYGEEPKDIPKKPKPPVADIKSEKSSPEIVIPEEVSTPQEKTYTDQRKSILGLEKTDFKKIKETGDTSTAEFKSTEDAPMTEEKEGFGSKAKRFFGKMAERTAGSFEMMSQAAKESAVVRKMEMTYSQRHIDQETEKIEAIKNEITEIDAEISKLEKAKTDLETAISELAGQVSTAALDVKLKVLDLKIAEEKKGKAEAEKELAEREKAQEDFIKKRDIIADKFIKEYEAKLKPMEDELAKLQTRLDDVEILIASQEIRHKEEEENIANLEKQIKTIREINTAMGMNERQNNRDETIRKILNKIEETKNKIDREKEILAEQKIKIEEKIIKVNEKALPFKEKKEIFVAIKENKPANMVTAPVTAPTSAAPATPTSAAPATPATPTRDNGGNMETQKLTIERFLKDYNIYIKAKRATPEELIDLSVFSKKMKISENQKVNREQFQKLIELFYRIERRPDDKLKAVLADIKKNAERKK